MSNFFTCPQCQQHCLEEIMVDVSVSSEVAGFDGDDGASLGLLEYGDQTNEGGEVSHFQCGSCGFILVSNNIIVTTVAGLREWLNNYKRNNNE